ncbi:MAG: hypothetical protein ACE5G0_14980 [Rhodothermales bacterium]
MSELLVGIDPGRETGLAVYALALKELLECRSCSFWEAVVVFRDHLLPLGDGGVVAEVVIEDSRRLPLYARNRKRRMTREARDRMCRSVGRIDRDIALWEEWLRDRGYEVLLVEPSKEAKWTAEDLRRICGWAESTNQHGRDAARLVWGRKPGAMVENTVGTV